MDEPAFVDEYVMFLDTFDLDKINSDIIGSDVTKSIQLLKEAFEELKKFLIIAGKSKQPSKDKVEPLTEGIKKKIEQISAIEAKSKEHKALNHLKSLCAISPALMWVVAPMKPSRYIKDMIDSSEFYTNRILKDYKDKEPEHRDFVKKLLSLFKNLQTYVNDFHPAGLTWNPNGDDVCTATSGGPPGAPPSGPPAKSSTVSSGNGSGAAALFASINKGGAITSGLKKVDDSMKTHKNPELRATSVVKETPKTGSPAKAATITTNANKPPVFNLANKKWTVEYQKDQQLTITEGGLAYTIYMYKCVGTTVIVDPKMNSISLEGCEKCNVILKSGIISSCDLINSKKCNIQCDDVVPTVSLDGCDSSVIYLSEKSLASDIITSKSSSSNITIMKANGENVELYVPEIFRSKVSNDKLLTEAVVHE